MKTILVPSDFSRNADTALRYAIRVSKLTKANLLVFHCAFLPAFIHVPVSASPDRLEILTKEDEAFKMKKLTGQVKKAYQYFGISKIPVSVKILVESKPLLTDGILEVAKKCQADIIITGTHGATGLNRYFFGSNTVNLISRSGIPVLAIPAGYHYKTINSIALASDLDNLGNELDRLLPFAKAMKATINVLHLDYGIDVGDAHIRAAMNCIGKCNYKKVKLVKQAASIEHSMISQLKKYLTGHRDQWLVMFTRERGFWDKLFFGGKTELISYSIKIPLLSFKKG